MTLKYTLVNPLGFPIGRFSSLKKAFLASQKVFPTNDHFSDVREEMNEDGDVLLDSGLSIYQSRNSVNQGERGTGCEVRQRMGFC